MANKTESRSVAEWSLRSSIAYTMVVCATHFPPNVKRTSFRPKKKDLPPRSVEMWNIVEDSYNKMLGSTREKIELLPALPNLVTSTDEVTIFATSSTINKKETLYLVAKPEEIKKRVE